MNVQNLFVPKKRIYNEVTKREEEREIWETKKLFSARPQLSGPIHIYSGFKGSFPFKIQTPVRLPPSLIQKSTPAMFPCEYCGTLFPENETRCPNCGAFRKA